MANFEQLDGVEKFQQGFTLNWAEFVIVLGCAKIWYGFAPNLAELEIIPGVAKFRQGFTLKWQQGVDDF